MKKGGSFNETFNLVVSTKKSSADQSLIQNRWKHRPTIDLRSPENPTPHFCSPKIGRLSAWVNVNNRIINHVECTERIYNDKADSYPQHVGKFFNFHIFIQFFIYEVKKTLKFWVSEPYL